MIIIIGIRNLLVQKQEFYCLISLIILQDQSNLVQPKMATVRTITQNQNFSIDQQNSTFTSKMFNDKENRALKKVYAKPELLEECLLTLDIFKSMIEDAEQMKNRIIRDVTKSIIISTYNQGDLIYDIQDQSNEIFIVFQGKVSLNIKTIKTKQDSTNNTNQNDQNEQIIFEQVQSYNKGQGFGQAEFIRRRKRDFQACVKSDQSVIGRLHIGSFEEVIDNYKMRIYFKKLEMFQKCPLLSGLSMNRLQFIVNSSKPVLLSISKALVKQGQQPKCLYLVSKGQLQITKNDEKQKFSFHGLSSWKSKKFSKYFMNSIQNKQKIQIRKINQGSFLGDVQIALQQPFAYDVKAASQKVYLYACDIRLILSQIPTEQLQNSKLFYVSKFLHHKNQLAQIKQTKKTVQQNAGYGSISLTSDQIRIKKQIQKRYDYSNPCALIDQCSPFQISKMLQRKISRIKTHPCQIIVDKLPKLCTFEKQQQKHNRHISYTIASPIRNSSQHMQLLSPASKKSYALNQLKINSEREMNNVFITNGDTNQNTESRDKKYQLKKIGIKINLPPLMILSHNKKRQQHQKNRIPQNKHHVTVESRFDQFLLKIQLQKAKEVHF